ncbi:MFS transporter [Methanobrevibacter sp.]|uniref:MFS transporter n=1 Tax=Methanobrevibacter sp. TaxID=66852 RepID=UPI00388CFE9F
MFLTDKINKINLNCWALYCIFAVFTLTIFGYGVYFLTTLGFSYIVIGVTIGISALLSSIMQPLIGRFADIRQYSWKNILFVLNIIMLISSLGIFVAPHYLLIFLFGLMVVVLGAMYPFLNTAVFYYENRGIETNFGVSRGFASLSYMIFSAIVGFILVDKNNVMIINLFTVISAVLMLFLIYSLPYYGSNVDVENKSKQFRNNVLLKYPIFTLIFIAIALFMVFHNIFLCYMINIFENVGGNISDVSLANSIGAFLELPAMFLFAKILKRVSVKKLIVIASLLYVVRSFVILTAKDPMGIYISLILHMFTFAIIIPASVHFTDEIISEEDKYEGQALMGATLTIGLIFANFIGGNILQLFDVNLLLVSLVVITVIGCIFALTSFVVEKK